MCWLAWFLALPMIGIIGIVVKWLIQDLYDRGQDRWEKWYYD